MNEPLAKDIDHTEFKDGKLGRIPKDWSKLQVQKAFDLGRGRVISKDEIRNNHGIYPVFSSQSINNGRMGSISTYDFNGEYITWTTDGAHAGTVFYRNGKFNCTNVCGIIKDNKRFSIDLKFVAAYLSTVAKKYVSYVGNPKLMNGVFAEIEFLLPPLPEQKKIAAILSSVDEVIENTQKQIDKSQDLKKAAMNELLTRGIGHTEFKDSEFGRIPREWKVYILGLGIDILPGFPFESKKFTDCPSYIGLIRIRDLIKQKLGTFYKGDYEKKYVVTKGDILIGMDGDFNIVKWKSADALLNQRICKLKPPRNSLFDLDFILYDLQKELYLIHQITSSTTVKHLSIKDIRNIKKAFPPLSEQKKIAAILTSIDEKIENTREKLRKYQSLKKALMQDLLTGRVRMQVD